MLERCKRICGRDRKKCFVQNKEQITCIADMVINKIGGITSLIELTLQESLPESTVKNLERTLDQTYELVNWVKFLQVAHDLKKASLLADAYTDTDKVGLHERRSEQRYHHSESYRKYLQLTVKFSDSPVSAEIINFSEHGILFLCSSPVEINSFIDCSLATCRTIKKELSFKAKVVHCTQRGGDYKIGVFIKESVNNTSFDFFKGIHHLIIETIQKDHNDG
ncbi:PilZ domain protein [bacterium BMS3Bbin06]|nr:PilZ domain protein [bacterium BMS3Bbin06]HDO35572.1 PilZ domain-containing protein [Nitrospirota bacterium]